jgi:hypothetical protein
LSQIVPRGQHVLDALGLTRAEAVAQVVRTVRRDVLVRPRRGRDEPVSLTLAPVQLAGMLRLLWTGPGLYALDRRLLSGRAYARPDADSLSETASVRRTGS